MNDNALIRNIDKIHTTELGVMRIRRNLELDTDDVVKWCIRKIHQAKSVIKKGKNWYVSDEECIITVNARSYTIITAHRNVKK